MYGEGNVIQGRYRLERRLGEGGMATVWRASHLVLHRPVAIKFVHPSSRHADETAKQFLREARAAAAVSHRNVVDIIDFGVAENDDPYMVMELLEGETLADRLNREPGLTAGEIAQIFGQLLRGLGAVHEAGIVHRDLKPENVFLVHEEDEIFVKLLDFGVSRAAAETGLESVYDTRESLVVGTPHYMSPEQARGIRDLDLRTDVYAVGAMLFEVLAARPPFDAELPGDLIVEITTEDAPSLSTYRPDLSDALCEVVARSLRRDREERFDDARSMRRALAAAMAPRADLPRPSWPDGPASEQGSAGAPEFPGVSGVCASRPTAPTMGGDDRADRSATRSSLRPVDVRAARHSGPPGPRTKRVAMIGAAAAVLVGIAVTTGWLATRAPADAAAGAEEPVHAAQPPDASEGGAAAEPAAELESASATEAATVTAAESATETETESEIETASASETATETASETRAERLAERRRAERRARRRAERRRREREERTAKGARADADPDAEHKIVRDPGF